MVACWSWFSETCPSYNYRNVQCQSVQWSSSQPNLRLVGEPPLDLVVAGDHHDGAWRSGLRLPLDETGWLADPGICCVLDNGRIMTGGSTVFQYVGWTWQLAERFVEVPSLQQ